MFTNLKSQSLYFCREYWHWQSSSIACSMHNVVVVVPSLKEALSSLAPLVPNARRKLFSGQSLRLFRSTALVQHIFQVLYRSSRWTLNPFRMGLGRSKSYLPPISPISSFLRANDSSSCQLASIFAQIYSLDRI